MAEIGYDSRRHDLATQAKVLSWQVGTAAAAGCAGAFVFAWTETDEWHRGGYDIEDWDFGLTTRDRTPKPALAAAREAFARLPPRPAAIAAQYPYRVISTPNRGLSAARNTGLQAATGDLVAYTDDDARPDPDWLTQLALTLRTTSHAAVGGRTEHPASWRRAVADCVANAPGGPIHVLVSDREASTSPAATWPSGGSASWPSAASTRGSAPAGTTSTCAGACWTGGGASASTRPRWCGTTAATPYGRTGASSAATVARAKCLS